jgi:hypothetical protein
MRTASVLVLTLLSQLACGQGDAPPDLIDDDTTRTIPPGGHLEEPFTSDVATLLDFDFDGELVSSSGANVKGQVRAQLLYTVGHLNAEPGVARLDKLVLSGTSVLYIGGGLYRVRYHAHLPVAWGSKTDLPSTYSLTLPRRVDATGQAAFTRSYGQVCNDGDAASVNVSNYWYHYRPRPPGCSLAAADVTTAPVTITVDASQSYDKYPEYEKMWEDGMLNVVVVFGKYEAGATAPDDAGIAAYNELVARLRVEMPDATTVPLAVTDSPGPATTDITFTAERAQGTIHVNVLLVDAITAVSSAWNTRYAQLTPNADVIIYDGHAGLGANVAALVRKGKWFPGKYQIFFLNGCDTFAYYDGTLPNLRAQLNPEDPTGTRYMDFITNAMPAYFISLADDALALIRAASDPTEPQSYQEIFHDMDRQQVVVVTGEEDNVFGPSYDPGISWNGLAASGAVGKGQTMSYVTEDLSPGRYVFQLSPDPAHSGGDADLRVRVGAAPTLTSTYKCPSYVGNSNERCKPFVLDAPSKIYVAVTGDATGVSSPYIVRAFQLPSR